MKEMYFRATGIWVVLQLYRKKHHCFPVDGVRDGALDHVTLKWILRDVQAFDGRDRKGFPDEDSQMEGQHSVCTPCAFC